MGSQYDAGTCVALHHDVLMVKILFYKLAI